MKRLLLASLCCLTLLAGCTQAPSPAAPAADEVTTTTVVTTTTATTATTVYSPAPFPLEAPYDGLVTGWGDTYYWITGQTEYGSCNAITTKDGQVLLKFDSGPQDAACSLDLPGAADAPVRFLINGNIYDENCALLPSRSVGYLYLGFRPVGEEWYIVGENEVGYFLLDWNGRVVEQLDAVRIQETLPGGKLYKTIREGFRFNRYGVRDKNFGVILPEIYLKLYPLSADRIVGSDTTVVQSDDAWYTTSIIVDGKGNTVCDKYHGLHFMPREDGSYYPYGIARLAVDRGDEVHYFLVDWDGQPLNDTPIEGHPAFADGVFTVKIDGQEVRYSAETGERVS
jgi:hypothetical protein